MFLSAYHFDGDPTQLVAPHQRLLERYPLDGLDLDVCVTTDTGVVILDACPSRAVHNEFSRSSEFLGAVTAASLPAPRIEPLGEVHLAHRRAQATR